MRRRSGRLPRWWPGTCTSAATGVATSVVRALDAAGVTVDNIEVRQPSLDDVFFSLTGGHIVEEVTDGGGEDGSAAAVGDGVVAAGGADGSGADGADDSADVASAAAYAGNGHREAESMEGVQS